MSLFDRVVEERIAAENALIDGILPLNKRKVLPTKNWHEWLVRWHGATYHEMVGLLLSGFDVPLQRRHYAEKEYAYKDKAGFYLRVADGWSSFSLMRGEVGDSDKHITMARDANGNPQLVSVSDLRRMVASKALDVVTSKVFAQTPEGEGRHGLSPFWERHILGDLFPMIQHFFRNDPEEGFVNFPARHERGSSTAKKVHEFLCTLARTLFQIRAPVLDSWLKEEEKQAMSVQWEQLEVAKPWMVEVLDHIGELNLLRPYMLDLSEACEAKLLEIALQTKLPDYLCLDRVPRPAKTLEEAVVARSKAGRFLQEIRTIRKGQRRLLSEKARAAAVRETEADFRMASGVSG